MARSRFENKVVFVTGAASGLGRATAKGFAAEGASVFAVDVDTKGIAATLDTIRDAGGSADGGICDVSSSSAVRQSIAKAVERFGGLDVLANVAGIGRAARLEEI